ncbi:MAG TPA: HEAT repeat domain-containing protein [Pirellulaceae bacterium]|nr:HEAT repeat domain-containing protein [Pirellulaceae bacterium]
MATEKLDQLFEFVDSQHGNPGDLSAYGPEIEEMTDSEVESLLAELYTRLAIKEKQNETGLAAISKLVFVSLIKRAKTQVGCMQASPDHEQIVLQHLRSIYPRLDAESEMRHYLLAWLAMIGTENSLAVFNDFVINDPPMHSRGIVVAFQPLFSDRAPIAALAFPRLLEGLQHVHFGAPILDLANFLTRGGLVVEHPATCRSAALCAMLQSLTNHLGRIESGNFPRDASPTEISDKLEQSVALVVSLCDALALIGQEAAIPKLRDAMELKHRRIQVEAAAALCRLGDKASKDKLFELLDEPVTRLRVIQYAEELGLADEIDDQFKTDDKRAESQLALWLSQPSQMGFAPSEVAVIDRRTLFWPGYNDAVECYLVEFKFRSPSGVYRNVGITGPLTFVFSADLTGLSRFDQYAAFAGWHAAHEDILEIPYQRACVAYRNACDTRLREIADQGYQHVEPLLFGLFFGEHILVASARKVSESGQVIADGQQVFWFSQCSEEAPVCGELAYCIYKGRRLLTHFNPQLDENVEAAE